MSVEAHFLHRYTAERPSGTAQDAYGNVTQCYAVCPPALRPGRLVEKTQVVRTDERVAGTTSTTYMLLAGADDDLQALDRVTVVDLGAEGYDARRFTVKAVLQRRGRARHHLSAQLEAIK